jgi:hypothetical protein
MKTQIQKIANPKSIHSYNVMRDVHALAFTLQLFTLRLLKNNHKARPLVLTNITEVEVVITLRGYDDIRHTVYPHNGLLLNALSCFCELEVIIATEFEVWDLVSFEIENGIGPLITLDLVIDVDARVVSGELIH